MGREALEEAVHEGVERVQRTFPALLSTGTVGGVDVSIGILAMYIVLHETSGNLVLGALAFTVGFIALTLAGSELFTENFLVPIAAVAAGEASWTSVVRLWAGTLVFNLLGGWILMALVVSAFPDIRSVAIDSGRHFAEIGIGWRSFSLAILAGAIITLMTWMEQTGGDGATRIAGAVMAGFLLAVGEMNHAIVASLEMFAGLIAGAPYGYADWVTMFGWAVLGNLIGGIGLVTALRLIQFGGDEVGEVDAEGS